MAYTTDLEKLVLYLEEEKIDFHKRVYDGYKQLCEKYPERIKAIDADRSVEEVHLEVREVIDGLLGL